MINKEYKKEYDRQYYLKHKENKIEYSKKWYLENKEHKRKYDKQYRIENEKKIKERGKQFRLEHAKEINEQHRQAYWKNPQKGCEDVKRRVRINPNKYKIIRLRARDKKYRNLDFIPLNEPKEGWEPHHINLEEVIFMPRELHRSISHNVHTGKNMDIINALAFNYK